MCKLDQNQVNVSLHLLGKKTLTNIRCFLIFTAKVPSHRVKAKEKVKIIKTNVCCLFYDFCCCSLIFFAFAQCE